MVLDVHNQQINNVTTMKNVIKVSALILALGGTIGLRNLSLAAEEETQTIKGEIVDLMCYLDHGAKGEKHKGCAEKCIKSGGPVGLLSGDTLYLVIGEHKPINEELASKAAQTVTLKGKVVEKHGVKMIENAKVVEE
jgi:hypothetical protein